MVKGRHPDIVRRLGDRQRDAEDLADWVDTPTEPAYDFLTSGELSVIILDDRSWRHFDPVLRPRRTLGGAFDRISAVRNAVAHSRLISQDAYEALIRETEPILKRCATDLPHHQGNVIPMPRRRAPGGEDPTG